jgi:signal transduction histidine kinase
MDERTLHILLIDDDEDDFVLTRELLAETDRTAFRTQWIKNYDEALEAMCGPTAYDACLVDYRLGENNGITLIAAARERGVEFPIILLTGQGDREVDLAAMNAGAADFLDKSQLTADLLERALRYSIHSRRIESQRSQLLAVAEQQAAQLRYLASELTQAEQRERRRVAQTLHDHLQQLLVATKMRLDRTRNLSRQSKLDADKLNRAMDQMATLINDAIEASRSLTVQLSPPVLHDRGLVPALQWLSRQFEKEHDLVVEVDADGDEETHADGSDDHVNDFLFQSVRELLFNVVKHAKVKRATVIVRHAGDTIQVTVSDEGVGCSRDRLIGGSSNEGFGLFHMQQRVEFFGGDFDVETGDRRGCRVTLRLPAQGEPVRRQPRPNESPAGDAPSATLEAGQRNAGDAASSPSGQGSIRVVIADDHKILREGLVGLLRDQAGIDVVGEASDGQAAVELCQRLNPDVIVMDVTMPGMTGIEATRIIREQMPQVQVIGLSMHEKDDMSAAMREAGAVAYLPKGGPSEDLVHAIWRFSRPEAPAAAG